MDSGLQVCESLRLTGAFKEAGTTRQRGGASLLFECGQSGGKDHYFGVYLEQEWFDTPENRVLTSGLTWLRCRGISSS